jgi:hypothetical protein
MIYGAELTRFKEEHWSREAYSCELTHSIMASLKSELDDFDVHAIARRHDRPITVWFGEGQHKSVEMSCEDALNFYDAGYQIYITNIARSVLREWCRHLSEALDVPDNFQCDVLATKAPRITATHFDAPDIFTVQLVGTKIWSVAENTAVRLPTVNYNGNAPRHNEEMGLFVKKFPIPAAPLPRDYRLTPGHMIYLPRGFWHGVMGMSDQPMVSLLIRHLAVTWADLIASAFRTLLLQKARWRENAKLPAPDASADERSRFHSIVSQAAEELSALRMSFLVPWKTLEPVLPPKLIRNPLATLTYEESREAQHIRAISTVHLGPYTRVLQADIPTDFKPVLEFVRSHKEVHIAELKDMSPGTVSFEHALETLRKLDLVRPDHSVGNEMTSHEFGASPTGKSGRSGDCAAIERDRCPQ